MELNGLLLEMFGRVDEHVHDSVQGLDAKALTTAPADGANTIGWLVWHITRVQDSHVADLLDGNQLWVTADWAQRFGLEPDPDNTGYGHSATEAAAIAPESSSVLIEYHQAVAARTKGFLDTVTAADLDRVVDEQFDPPVTLGVRLVSIVDDSMQHAGQAKYVRGLLGRG
jgi:uncharacterized damage-inducible protein DinB